MRHRFSYSSNGNNRVKTYKSTFRFYVEDLRVENDTEAILTLGTFSGSGNWGTMLIRAIASHRGMAEWVQDNEIIIQSGDHRSAIVRNIYLYPSQYAWDQLKDVRIGTKSIKNTSLPSGGENDGDLNLVWAKRKGLSLYITIFIEWVDGIGVIPAQ